VGLSSTSGNLHRDGGMDLYRTITVQASIHMAGFGARPSGNTCISFPVSPDGQAGTSIDEFVIHS
jgi:hypothetical protein